MNGISKKLVAAVTVAAFGILGVAAPVHAAGSTQQSRTVWCC